MGRGRQKAKQTKIARKLKYLTTDTDYNELEKELSHHDDDTAVDDVNLDDVTTDESIESAETEVDAEKPQESEDLDDYAAWAAEAAKRAEESKVAASKPHKPFPKIPGLMPKPKA